jgi:hypothetical protein
MNINNELQKRLKKLGYSDNSIANFESRLGELNTQEAKLVHKLLMLGRDCINGYLVNSSAYELGINWKEAKRDVLKAMFVWKWRSGYEIDKKEGVVYLCLDEDRVQLFNNINERV